MDINISHFTRGGTLLGCYQHNEQARTLAMANCTKKQNPSIFASSADTDLISLAPPPLNPPPFPGRCVSSEVEPPPRPFFGGLSGTEVRRGTSGASGCVEGLQARALVPAHHDALPLVSNCLGPSSSKEESHPELQILTSSYHDTAQSGRFAELA